MAIWLSTSRSLKERRFHPISVRVCQGSHLTNDSRLCVKRPFALSRGSSLRSSRPRRGWPKRCHPESRGKGRKEKRLLRFYHYSGNAREASYASQDCVSLQNPVCVSCTHRVDKLMQSASDVAPELPRTSARNNRQLSHRASQALANLLSLAYPLYRT